MDIFRFRDQLIQEYAQYVTSFIHIRDGTIREYVDQQLGDGVLWPDPLIQLNPSFEPGDWIDALVEAEILHEECGRIFCLKSESNPDGEPLRLHRHQAEAIRTARDGHSYVLTTGTGSGKSLAYIIPIVDHVLRHGSGKGVQAIVVYPMNALANSQLGELTKFLGLGYPNGRGPVTFERYTGQEDEQKRQEIIANPPDILLTNYVMLELILTRPRERKLIEGAQGLQFLVLDELHTYRGRQGADVAMLVRRTRDVLNAQNLQCVGTSATLAGPGSYEEQRLEVARVASQLFGSEITPEHVIGETLRRTTPARDLRDPAFIQELTARIADPARKPPGDYQGFVYDPLSIWLESTFGVRQEGDRLIRTEPLSIRGTHGDEGAAHQLSQLTGVPYERCVEVIQEGLLAGYECEPVPETGFPAFAFRLHQFISRGDTVYASPEVESERHVTFQAQQFVPRDRHRVLLPLVFCRECGQEYYCVWMNHDSNTEQRMFTPRELNDSLRDEGVEPGFLYVSTDDPWPEEFELLLERLPDDWLEDEQGVLRVRRSRRDNLPRSVRVGTDGREHSEGLDCHYISAPFRFCLHCGVAYDVRRSSDFGRLASLASEGRSTATTILSLSAIRGLRNAEELKEEARKLLSFTDNRQDASLQAGHFNDFIEIGQLRSALYRAVSAAGESGMTHEQLTQRVFDAFDLALEHYATDPGVRFQARTETERALRDVLGYRLYRDLKRGWRVTSPNLEQCGLLQIQYLSLEEVCAAEDVWGNMHQALVSATPETRAKVGKVLLDHLRRELAIKVDYLDQSYQEQIQQRSSQRLKEPWALDENEQMEHASVLYPRGQRRGDHRGNVYLSPRGGFGRYLRRNATLPECTDRLKLEDADAIIRGLLEGLRVAGLVEIVSEPRGEDQVPGYQLPASCLLWKAGDGSQPFHDPIRVPSESVEGGRANPFFVEFYRTLGAETHGLEAREHTAQVPSDERQQREDAFREAKLPILYCSPTMELGVDIAELNVVNLRNMPPTPANYAQRSGRAGRSGQPALVFSYCTTGSSHDQYFFKRPNRMVAGAVTPPRLEVANEDLVKAHIHALWLAETRLSLGKSLKDILDVSGDEPTLELLDSVREAIEEPGARAHTRARATRVLSTIAEDLEASDWHHADWLDDVLNQVALEFDRKCERWRGLYRSALSQFRTQNRVIEDASRSHGDKEQARRLRREAEAQLELLTNVSDVGQSDFYSYRYFASEGFLPGYSFPRLPLSAYIPGRRGRQRRDEMISRPRFLAISEFGPRSIVYHEGSRYQINKAILPVDDDDVLTRRAKLCGRCGYLHPITEGDGFDCCQRCGDSLETPLTSLFRLQNVATHRRDRISSDEEERIRLGYEIITGVRFTEHRDGPSYRMGMVEQDGTPLAQLIYGPSALLWRINLGWARRINRAQFGFVLDTERGYWARNEQLAEEDPSDPMSARTQRVIPYVEDHRNCLLLEPTTPLEVGAMAALQSALKNAIQVRYELEDNELAAEPLPDRDTRRLILFYESAEGGAGVLRRLLDHPQSFAEVAREALNLCHFDPDTGEDLRRALRAREDCEAACYDCLMTYTNQRDHALLDRQTIQPLLMQYSGASVAVSPTSATRSEHLKRLSNLAESGLERSWLYHLDGRNYRLPSDAQVLIESCETRPDFIYEDSQTVVYIDGPPHDTSDQHQHDLLLTDRLEDAGYTVVRFRHDEDWDETIAKYPNIFGKE